VKAEQHPNLSLARRQARQQQLAQIDREAQTHMPAGNGREE